MLAMRNILLRQCRSSRYLLPRLVNNGLGAAMTLGCTGLRLSQVQRYAKLFISKISIQIYSVARVAFPTVILQRLAYDFDVSIFSNLSLSIIFTLCKPV